MPFQRPASHLASSGRCSRAKGASAERELSKELVRLFALHGFDAHARRTAPLQAGALKGLVPPEMTAADVTCSLLPDDHVECKRDECSGRAIREACDSWCAQAARDCNGKRWLVAWRQNRQPWRVTLPLRGLVGDLPREHYGRLEGHVTLALADFVAIRAAQMTNTTASA